METAVTQTDVDRRRPRAYALDPARDELTRDSRARLLQRLRWSEWRVSLVVVAAFVAASAAAVVLVGGDREFSVGLALLLILGYAAASHVEFEIGAGSAVPTQLVLVPMLFLLPLGLVPICVALGMLLGAVLDHLHGGVSLDRAAAAVPVSAAHAFGPVLVLALAGTSEPRLADAPVYAVALAAQFAVDFAASTGWEWRLRGIPPQRLARYMVWVYGVDVALAAVGLSIAFASKDSPGGLVLALPLVALLAYFARERQTRINHALDLSTAYRGTALLLGDVIEADDAYTGSHSRDVVELSLAVADRFDLDARTRQRVELAALLHDVGKIRIPNEIINKPGKLDAAERAVIKTHAVEGERMLENVGGLLADVGHIVRSCHEHWDGAGYPDGLVGNAIPLEARIVCACDAFNAMTTDRPYRAARSLPEALAELDACAGTHFDPDVVEALEAVLAG